MTSSDRKSEILDVAKRIFAERGIKNTTVRQIGAEAGILSGSLYHHFDSKLDMVDDILGSFCEDVLGRYRAITASGDSGVERLRSMVQYAVSLIDQHRAALVMIQADSAELVVDPRFAYLVEFNAEVERHWLDALREGMRGGSFRESIDPAMTYRFVRDAILGANSWFEPNRGRTLSAVADELTNAVLFGITVP